MVLSFILLHTSQIGTSLFSIKSLKYEIRSHVYIQVYGGKARISTLQNLLPLLEDKKSIISAEDLAMVEGKVSLLAAIGYYASMQSDIFIFASRGNMHNALVGHRSN